MSDMDEEYATFDEGTKKRIGTAAARMLDHVLCSVLVSDDDFVPLFAGKMPYGGKDGSLTFDGVFADQRDVWPRTYPGWTPLTIAEFRHAWGAVGMMMVSS